MKAIVQLYFRYLSLALACLMLTTLVVIVIAGVYASKEMLEANMSHRNRAMIPTVITMALSLSSLFAFGVVGVRRSRVLADHPELKAKPFKDFRLYKFAFKSKTALAVIPLLVLLTLGATTYTTRLLNNQAIVTGSVLYPATFFNRAVIIRVTDISEEGIGGELRVTAVVHSDDYPDEDVRIDNDTVGYETAYTAGVRYVVRVTEIASAYAKFFIERTEGH